MPRKLAFTGGHQVEVVEYEDRPLAPNEVRIQTEYASGKHGTPLAMMDGRNEQGQRWDDEMRLFIPSEDDRRESETPAVSRLEPAASAASSSWGRMSRTGILAIGSLASSM